jgi:rhodanese-related sulfurtransferase
VPKFARVSPEEAQSLLAEGHVYVDVRTEQEFEAGHVPGAYNVPFRLRGPAGFVPNPDFAAVMQRRFGKEDRLVIGCQTGSRSLKAAAELSDLGYTNLSELRTGYEGSRDAFGRPDPGWSKKGLPVESGQPEGRRYVDLVQAG